MKKDYIKKLAKNSFVNSEIHPKIAKFVLSLSKTDLRLYSFYLKKEIREKTVFIKTFLDLTDYQKKEIENLYPDKKIVYLKDQTLGLGIIILDDDKIFDASFRTLVDQTISRLKN